MKKGVLILLISFVFMKSFSQDSLNNVFGSEDFNFKQIKLHHLKKMQSVDLRCLYAKHGIAYEFNYSYLISDEAMIHFGANYERGSIGFTKYDYKNIKVGVAYSVLKLKQRIFISPDLSFIAGIISGTNSDFNVTDKYINVGGSLGINVEIYITNKLCLLLVGDQQYNFNDRFGKLHYNIGGGLRYYFN